ncbi:Xaa-Pro peptidase family protein [soil metagenome]
MAKGKKKAVTTAARQGITPVQQWRIGNDEYDQRVRRVREELERRKLDGLVLFQPIRMAFVTGFFHLSTERPMAIVISREGGVGGLIPHLEQGHFAKANGVTNTAVYPEYPTGGGKHPMHHLADLLKEMKLNAKGIRLGYDNNGYLDINGYDGPELSEVVAGWVETVNARDIVDHLRSVKSAAELGFIGGSCVWGNLAHRLMHEGIEVGRGAIEIGLEASGEASEVMVAALGPGYEQMSSTFGFPAMAGFSAGAGTVMPHGLLSAIGLRPGDVLVTYAGADVGGYQSELERTMILGEPDKQFIKHFEAMMLLQQVAFDALKPGRTLADAENDVSNAFGELGMTEFQRHHSGHGIGLEGHEWPFIDKGSAEVTIEENMVLSVEPGIYVPGLAGFRHSDTVVIRSGGAERLTYYPRDLESLIIPV